MICFPGKCENSLATPLPYSSFTSSSVYAGGYGAGYAKLHRKQGASGPGSAGNRLPRLSLCGFALIFGVFLHVANMTAEIIGAVIMPEGKNVA